MAKDMKNHIATMSVSLPKELKEHVKRRTRQDHYGTPSDYIRSLIREDIKKSEQGFLEKMLLEGLASGASTPMTSGKWKRMRSEVRSRVKESA